MKVIWLKSHPPLEKHLGPHGEGTISVGQAAAGQRWFRASTGWPGAAMMKGSAIVLMDVPDADRVYAQLSHQIAGARASAA